MRPALGITPLGPKDAGGPGLLADTGAFPVLGVRVSTPGLAHLDEDACQSS